MKPALVVAFAMAAFAMVGAGGCGPSGVAPPVVASTLANYGGLEALRDVSAITATAVITAYDEDGVARVSAADVVIRPNAGRIEATGRLPQGTWRAKVKLDGGASVRTGGSLRFSPERARRIGDALRLILHRVRGPLNLVDGGETVGAVEVTVLGGEKVTRVATAGRDELATAYYFDARAEELRYILAGPAAPGERGEVTTLRNKRMPDGLVLPIAMEVVRAGENNLLGVRKALRVQLQNVRVR